MKKRLLTFLGLVGSMTAYAQPVSAPGASPDWLRGGNTGALGNPNVIGPTWNGGQMWFTTAAAAQYRMAIFGGAIGVNDGRIGFGNSLAPGFVAQDRLHSHVTGNTGVNFLRFTSTNTGAGPTDGFALGNDNGNGFVRYIQYETRPQTWFLPDSRTGTNLEFMRLTNGGTGPGVGNSTDGYMGLNQPAPVWHIDGVTPAHTLGEMFMAFNPSDVPGSKMGMFNAAGGNNVFLPMFFGNVDATQTGPGVQYLGNIHTSQDIAANNTSAVTRFVSSQGWQYNVAGLSPLAVRHLFSWGNAGNTHMLMNVNGRMRMMQNLAPLTNVPGNRLEITAATTDPYGGVIAVNGASGLRFTHLNSSKTPVTNPNPNNVLSVDANGDVIYVNVASTGGSSLGSACGSPAVPLPASWYIPLNGNDFYFADDNPTKDKVHVGYNCSQGIGKFNVQTAVESNPSNPAQSYSIHSVNTAGNSSFPSTFGTGVYGEATSLVGSTFETGVWGKASASRIAIGVFGEADISFGPAYGGYFSSLNNSNITNYGLEAHAYDASSANYGVKSEARQGQFAWAGYFDAHDATSHNIGVAGIGWFAASPGLPTYPGGSNIGVYGQSNFNGTGAPGADWAAWFDGDVNINGAGYITSGVWSISDKRYKTDIKPLENVSEKIKKLTGYTYGFKTTEFPAKNFDNVQHIGLIAQELKEVFPELVRQDKNGYYAVNYEGMIPVLLEASKSQMEQIEAQQEQLSNMQQQIDELKNLIKNSSSQTLPASIELSDNSSIVLDQNVPNPFAESTTINYIIPGNFSKAQLIFMGLDGKVIRTYDIIQKGAGKLNVFANDLSSGVYTYTLVVDGKIIDTKKMDKH